MSDSGEPAPQDPIAPSEKSGLVAGIMTELTSPINVLLIVVCGVLVYRILKIKRDEWDSEKAAKDASAAAARPLPKMKRRDFTFDELKEFDGVKNSDGRILVAVNGKVLDVTRGKKLYGPGAPYACYAGRDASRGLATFSLGNSREGYDDLSDLKPSEMESLREWEAQLSEKYDCVGKFLRPGEKPTEYFDEEDSRSESPTKTDANLPEADRET